MCKEEKIREIEEKVKDCKKCELWKTRNLPVVGEGGLNTDIIFIGEAPGYNEDLKGKPFIGKAGKVFDELLESININRNDIYITNIIKCRPPNNRNPLSNEVESCSGYLERQIAIIKPKIIVTLGNFALSYIFKKFGLKVEKIGKVHGKTFKVGTITGTMKIIPLLHPATATYYPEMKSVLLKDFNLIKQLDYKQRD